MPGHEVTWTGSRSVPLSFEKLFRLHPTLVTEAEEPPSDTGHYLPDRSRVRRWRRYYRTEYSLEVTNYEVHELVRPLSRGYPDLVFVVSELCGDDGGVVSVLLHGGRCRRWELSERGAERHWRVAANAGGVPSLDDAYEDEAVRSEAEGAMLDEALNRWDAQVLQALGGRVARRT